MNKTFLCEVTIGKTRSARIPLKNSYNACLICLASVLWNLLCTHKVCNLFVGVLWLSVLLNFTCLQVSY